MDECPFCRIIAGESDAYVLYETERTIAFLDRNPATRGHTLVVPREHREYLFSTEASLAEPVFRTVDDVSMAIEKALDPDGVSLFYTTSTLVGEITHAHVHLLPRYTDDDIQLSLPRELIPEDVAEHVTERIRSVL